VDIADQIKSFISREILDGAGPRTVDDSTSLYDGILDSVALMQLVSYLEEEFGVPVADEDLTPDNFRNVDSIARLVRERAEPA
jgi:acyl carrier protein